MNSHIKKGFCMFTCIAILSLQVVWAQSVGSISGIVIDKDSEIPLQGANIQIISSTESKGGVTDSKGYFRISNLPVGRHNLQISYMGYKSEVINNFEVFSGKEKQLTIALEQLVYIHEDVVVKADIRKEKPRNDMALISARTFSVEETEKYAGSFGDPARMAATYAGVMQGGDQLNEIVIRGNSPAGLLYKLNGISIPNPTHFSSAGTSGGAISILNNNTLSNSDFYTSAFPAEFGNALSGVFDLRLRNGNITKREYLFQMGFNGFELGLEGPFLKNKGSTYLLHYRYSTLEVFDWLGLPLPVSSIPYFQDITFNVCVPLKRVGTLSVFVVAGKNHISFDRINQDSISSNSLFGSETAVLGINHSIFLKNQIKISTSFALTHRGDISNDQEITNTGIVYSWYGHNSKEQRFQVHSSVRYKINNRNTLHFGLELFPGWVSQADSTYNRPNETFIYINNSNDSYVFLESFAQLKHKFTDEFALVAGFHQQYLSINKEIAFEPRVAFSYDIDAAQSVNLGFGIHSQMQPRQIYFIETLTDTLNGRYELTNKNLKFTKSVHFVLGHQFIYRKIFRVKPEIYYQYLYKIPVERNPSYYSMLNYGSFGLEEGNRSDSLVNDGVGFNRGLELTIERFLQKSWYLMFTASLFESKYRGSDLIWRNTLFNSNFVFNLVGGYEINLKRNHSLTFDIKSVWAGGLRELPIDLEESIQRGRTVYDYSYAFNKRYGDYFRFDFKVSLKFNFSRVSHVIAFEIINSTNRKNHFIEIFNPTLGKIEESTQLGLTPLVLYRTTF